MEREIMKKNLWENQRVDHISLESVTRNRPQTQLDLRIKTKKAKPFFAGLLGERAVARAISPKLTKNKFISAFLDENVVVRALTPSVFNKKKFKTTQQNNFIDEIM
jgi:ribosomal protein L34E